MEIGQILSADVLDIIFDERNKEYGAYDLRKNYQRRLMKATASMLLVVVLLLVAYMLVAAIRPKDNKLLAGPDVVLIKVEPPPPPAEPLPPPPPPPPSPLVKTLILTPPLIVEDDKVKPEEMPPAVEELETAKIGLVNSAGADDADIVAPPVDASKGVVAAPEKKDAAEIIFTKVEIESTYPGGATAWGRFLNKNLPYPQDAVDNGIQGIVSIQFIVDKEGNVSDVTAISGPEELRKAAVTVIKKSGKWEPAVQNGQHVKSYKTQPVVFKLEE